jgi:hypothetical protein
MGLDISHMQCLNIYLNLSKQISAMLPFVCVCVCVCVCVKLDLDSVLLISEINSAQCLKY